MLSVGLRVALCGSDGEDHVTFSLGVFDMVRTASSAFELGVGAIDKVNVVDVGSALSSAVLEVLELEGDNTPDHTTDSLTNIAKVLELDLFSVCSTLEVLKLEWDNTPDDFTDSLTDIAEVLELDLFSTLEVLELEGDDTPDDTTDSLTDITEVLELHWGIILSGVIWNVIDWNILWSSCDWQGCWHHVAAFRDTVVVHLLSCLFS